MLTQADHGTVFVRSRGTGNGLMWQVLTLKDKARTLYLYGERNNRAKAEFLAESLAESYGWAYCPVSIDDIQRRYQGYDCLKAAMVAATDLKNVPAFIATYMRDDF